ncbi:Imprinted and ancient [Mycena sanguinolenta]|uniref:Imprinted and ancient n=1 Tax=Mycena sanguinolenta TaxID=230812 RepID=A0A8H6XVV5_9AGAR|nr:Imprinted and ancient [Mycena sanguinolenta]
MHMESIQDPSCSKWASSSSSYPTSAVGCSSYLRVGDRDWRTSPMLSSTASDDIDEFEQPQLTLDSRRRPHSPVPPSPAISPLTPPLFAIPFPADNTTTTKSKDVPPVVNAASFRPPSPAPRFNGFSNSPLERPLSSASPKHVSINNTSTRPRTLYNHGLPHTLPPPPRPIAQRSASSTSPHTSFNFVRDNYLKMLAHKHTDTTAAAPAATVAPGDLASHNALEEINRLTGTPFLYRRRRSVAYRPPVAASPEWQSLGDAFPDFESTSPLAEDAPVVDPSDWINEPLFGGDSPFLTSPHEVPYDDFGTSPMETPFSSFLGTPSLNDLDMESPLITDTSPLMGGFNDDLELFGAASAFPTVEPSYGPSARAPPALDSIAEPVTVPRATGPVIPPPPASTAATRARRRSNVTGTRKNLTVAALIPLDAPTQKRTYVTPSATSRKAVPDAIVKKRLHSVAFSDDRDAFDEELGTLSPTASEAEIIEYKRRQNTLAARKSRKRKLEHQQQLENEVAELKQQVTMWRERAVMAQELLRGSGVNLPFDDIEES